MRALICGISGQDGAYLAKLLLERGYEVIGASRDAQLARFDNLVRLGVLDRVKLESMSPVDFRSVFEGLGAGVRGCHVAHAAARNYRR